MKPGIIRNEEKYEKALAYVESLMNAEPGSPQEEALELWSLLIGQYEQERHPMEAPDPIEAIRFRMDQLGLHRKDLGPFIGGKSKVSEVLNRKRPLSLQMIRSLHLQLGIPAAVLVRQNASLTGGKIVSSSRRVRSNSSKSAAATMRGQKKQTADSC